MTESTLDFQKVRRVQFGLLDPKEIVSFCSLILEGQLTVVFQQAMSVVQVENEKIYDNGIPTDGGINDLRMGTMDRALRCATCQGGKLWS